MKFNPFEPMTPSLMNALRSKGKRWLVSQTLNLTLEGAMQNIVTPLLLSHYEDQGLATVHLKAVQHDKYAAIIDLERQVHRDQLLKVLDKNSKYLVFSSLIRSKERAEKAVSDLYKEKYWKFIQQHARSGTNANKNLRPSIQLIFGEVFIVLKYGSETLRTKLEEIEKM